ncbi:hypothetical protein [Pseudosulfitobacter pseudonitzschiae]|uniref:hypothetical protein n=1 Tax=Pseudosulfitobacter pseudonitzschiae TaxID=1402135 RepID=UPI003B7FBD2F
MKNYSNTKVFHSENPEKGACLSIKTRPLAAFGSRMVKDWRTAVTLQSSGMMCRNAQLERDRGTNMRAIFKPAVLATILAVSTIATSASAQATDLTSMTGQLQGQLQSMATLAGYVSFLAGFVFGIMGFMKLKANAANPQDPSNKVSTAFMLIFVGAALIAVPTVMGIGVASLFGDGSNTTDLDEEAGGGFTGL